MTTPEAPAVPPLTFDAFRSANVKRCVKWHPAGIESWSPSDWLTAVTGELGELASLLKMRNRERDGLPGNKFSPTDKQVADELADVLTYLDLLAAALGVDLGRAAVEKFNEVSERVGFPDRIALAAAPSVPPAPPQEPARAKPMLPPNGGPRFVVCDGGAYISDEDFAYDGLLKIGGDFGEGHRLVYANEICGMLNAAAPSVPPAPQVPSVQISLDDEAAALLKATIGGGDCVSPITLGIGTTTDDDGTAHHGLYVYLTEYPEEGSVHLVDVAPAPPQESGNG